jgi:hypothetical protein
MTIFHVSEDPGIERFVPRAIEEGGPPVVWGIDEKMLRNYLLPRDCPRVTYYASTATGAGDIERFLGSSEAVIAVEHAWLERIRSTRLYCYRLPGEAFVCVDRGAGYFTSREPVAPLAVVGYSDLLSELARRGVEIRILRDLWHLHDAVAASTLQFSMIRMRNARPRDCAL